MSQTVDEVAERLTKVGVPSTPINTIDRIVVDPQIAGARNMFPEVDHPVAGRMKLTNNQLKFTAHPADPKASAPTLGQHNKDVYCDFLGLTESQFESLKENRII